MHAHRSLNGVSEILERAVRTFLPVLGLALIAGGCDELFGPPEKELVLRLHLTGRSLYVNDFAPVSLYEVGSGGDTVRVVGARTTWLSSDTSVARLRGAVIQGVSLGTATITAQGEDGSASLEVTVAGVLHRGPIRRSERWLREESPHVIDSSLVVAGIGEELATLTIDPGSLVLFRGNTAELDVANGGRGALVADGTEAPIVFEAEDSTAGVAAWRGIALRGQDASRLEHVTIRQCGGPVTGWPFHGCLRMWPYPSGTGPTVTLRDVVIRLGRPFGLVVEPGSRIAAGSARLSVHDIEGSAGVYPASELARFPRGGQFTGLTDPSIRLYGGEVSENTEWPDLGLLWRVTSLIEVGGPSGPRLFLEPGLRAEFEYTAGISVGRDQPGRLVVGAPGAPDVELEATADAYTGWRGIELGPFADTTLLSGVRLTRCGLDCLVARGDEGGSGPVVHVLDVAMTGSRFRGISLHGAARFAEGSNGLEISGSGNFPLQVSSEVVGTIPSGTYNANTDPRIFVTGGYVEQDAVWRDHGVPYRLQSGVGINENARLTLEPGVRLEFGVASGLFIGQLSTGILRAVGTPERPIVLTGRHPDPHPGIWLGVIMDAHATSESLLDHVVVEWASSGTTGLGGAIWLNADLGPVVRNTLVRNSGNCGFYRAAPGPWTTDFTDPALANTFENNAGPDQCGP